MIEKKVHLIAVDRKHLNYLYSILSQPSANQLSFKYGPAMTYEQLKDEFEPYFNYTKRSQYFIIKRNSNNQNIGFIYISNIDSANGKAEYGVHIDKKYQGLGYGERAAILIQKFAFEELNLDKLYYYIKSNNQRLSQTYNSNNINRSMIMSVNDSTDNNETIFLYGENLCL